MPSPRVSSDPWADVQKPFGGSASDSWGTYAGPEDGNEGIENTGNTNGDNNEDTYAGPNDTGAADPTSTATAETESASADTESAYPDPGRTGEGSENTGGEGENTGEGTDYTYGSAEKRTDAGVREDTGDYSDVEDTTEDNTGAVDTTGDNAGAVDTAGGDALGCIGEIFRIKKQHRHLKVLLSIGGWTYSPKFAPVAASEAGRQRFASSAVKLVADWGFDGLDIDWEYPKDETEAQNFVLLLKECRKALDEYSEAHAGGYHFELTVASPAGPSKFGVLDMEGMDPLLDAWHLMAYDYATSVDETSGHQAALFPSQENAEATKFNTKDAVEGYLGRGIAPQKISMGIPLYGRSFMNTDGVGKSFSGQGQGSIEQGVWLYKDLPRPGATEKWDESASASYSYDPSTRELVTYDNVQSATRKAEWIVEQNLGGVVFWEASGDKKGEGSLVEAVVAVAPSLDTTENLLDYPESRYANIRDGGSGVFQPGSPGEGSSKSSKGGSCESSDSPGQETSDASAVSSATGTAGDSQSGDAAGGQYDDGDYADSVDNDTSSNVEETASSATPSRETAGPSPSDGVSGTSGPEDSDAWNNGDVDNDTIGNDTTGDGQSDGWDDSTTDPPEVTAVPSSGVGTPCSCAGGASQSGPEDDGNEDTDTVDSYQAGSGEGYSSDDHEGTSPATSSADAPEFTGSGDEHFDESQLGGDDDWFDTGSNDPPDTGANGQSGNGEDNQTGEDDEDCAEGGDHSDVGNSDPSDNPEVTAGPTSTPGAEDENRDESDDDGEDDTSGNAEVTTGPPFTPGTENGQPDEGEDTSDHSEVTPCPTPTPGAENDQSDEAGEHSGDAEDDSGDNGPADTGLDGESHSGPSGQYAEGVDESGDGGEDTADSTEGTPTSTCAPGAETTDTTESGDRSGQYS